MAATILSFASSKGGPGKSTLTCLTASNLGERGARVAVLDADPSGRITQIGQVNNGALSKLFTVYPKITADTLIPTIQKINEDYDFILIDPEGVLTDLIKQIAVVAHLIISPIKLGRGDLDEAEKTAAIIRAAGQAQGREIKHCLLANDVPPSSRSMLAATYIDLLAKSQSTLLKTIVHTRVAYIEAPDTGQTLSQLQRHKADHEITALVDEVIQSIASHYGSNSEEA